MTTEEIADVLECAPEDVEKMFSAMRRGKELADQVGDVFDNADAYGTALGAAMNVAAEDDNLVNLTMEEAREIYRVLWAIAPLSIRPDELPKTGSGGAEEDGGS